MVYDSDGLSSVHNHDFMSDESFLKAYNRGIAAANGVDYGWYWRIHIGLWAGRTASNIQGDYVECGVNVGFLSSAIMTDLNWNTLDRHFYLLDTFSGLDPALVTDQERQDGIIEKNQKMIDDGSYVTSVDSVRENFSEFHNVKIIQGSVPHTLRQIDTDRIAFLHIDMNCAPPEVAAVEALWPRLTCGAVVLLDDYAYSGYQPQKEAMDALAAKIGMNIASLPTGQGLIIKGGQGQRSGKKRGILNRFF